ncbi:FtsX-like permease family protein [Anaerocolumna jejuensis DSM 15929]|uniref:FtsX-like permease family protein n=1 Tax=Anaerocolumna jejuensis DSM 15929 TaxID=1121322 RepID=A0A1M6SUN4_9FIRM|nr:ABC transporter permease [Anaerocolumna jejuensis]SHK48434.1 FtsX-like permease family protein [Anaerocolumna jejuensis DSM 15929]
MNLRKIARNGMKGRKKDSLLLKLVISLSFAFISAALIFQASMEKTKTTQREELYGSWLGAYLGGNEDTYNKLTKEKEVKELTCSRNLGTSEKLGIVGTFPKEFKKMGNFTLYQGRFPEKDNEIVVELNQLSNAGMELSVGQKIRLDMKTITVDDNQSQKISKMEQDAYNKGDYLERYGYHDNPSTDIGDINVVVSTDYVYLFKKGEPSDSKTIKKKGILTHQEITLQKEFTICGILNTYSDKWDLGGHTVPNAFVTEESGKALSEAFYNNSFINVDNKKQPMDIFFQLRSLDRSTFHKLAVKYPDKAAKAENLNDFIGRIWGGINKSISKAEDEKISKYYASKPEEPSAEDTGLIKENVSKGGDSTSNFRRNSFTYPDTGNSMEHIITVSILGIIFITTICAVFQIFLTQIKRRSRKLVLLKSIGATKGQLSGILFWEALYLWRTGMVFGILGGTGVSALILFIMKHMGKESIVIAIPLKLLLIGILIGSISLFAGVLLPAVRAVNIPLTGNMEEKQKHNKSAYLKNKKQKGKYVKQDFLHITLRYLKNNREKNLLSFAISLFVISILTASLYLSYNAFQRYRDSVLDTGKPDYTLKAVYGENQNKLPKIEAELKEIKGVKAVTSYKYGKNLLFWYDGIDRDVLLNTFKALLPDRLKAEHFSQYVPDVKDQPEYIKNACYSYYYGIDPDAKASKAIFSSVEEGSVDMEKFKKGEEVILLVPLYEKAAKKAAADNIQTEYKKVKAAAGVDKRFHWLLDENKAYYTSVDPRYKKLYDSGSTLKPGDTLYLSADKEQLSDSGKIIGYNKTQVKVGGIIHYFSEDGVWPFSNLVPCYTVIGSMDGMESLYTNSKMGLFRVNIEQMTEMVKVLYPSSYGRTLWNIKAEDKENQEVLDAALLTFANKYGFTLYNYKESSERVLEEALNNVLVIGLLGIISSVIALIAFYNTSVSGMEQERNRIGILQSMGVTKGQFTCQFLIQGVIQGTLAVILANAVLFLILLITASLTTDIRIGSFAGLFNVMMAEKLWQYPWLVHIAVSVIFIAIITVLQTIPAIRIAKQYPVVNIRSLGR